LTWKIGKSPLVHDVLCVPGNAGIAAVATCVDASLVEIDALVSVAVRLSPDLVVVGPEGPLVSGLCDALSSAGVRVFGPSAAAARLEGSKAFAKSVMLAANVPTANSAAFADLGEALDHVAKGPTDMVIKADGLAAGKGVIVCRSRKAAREALHKCFVARKFGNAASIVLIEDVIRGEEVSFTVLTDGERIVPLATATDYKRAYSGNRGPNTGGVGAYSPSPAVDAQMQARIMGEIIVPTLRELRRQGTPFRGALYAGLFINHMGPVVIEFNARFGDPELQPLLHRLRSDIGPYLLGCAEGHLVGPTLEWDSRHAVYVGKTSRGYPGTFETGFAISGANDAGNGDDVVTFHGGTKLNEEGTLVTAGGRVIGVSALDVTRTEAARKAYRSIERVSFRGAYCRADIGT
jgi:phosphoribosylamine---glycine ligase